MLTAHVKRLTHGHNTIGVLLNVSSPLPSSGQTVPTKHSFVSCVALTRSAKAEVCIELEPLSFDSFSELILFVINHS